MIETTQQQNSVQQQTELDYKEILFLCLSHWKWFLLSLFVTISFSVYYLLRTTPTYSSNSVVLMADYSSSLASNADLGMDVSMFTGSRNKKNNVYNDLEIFKSPSLMFQVVKELDLQMNYFTKGTFRDNICYGSNLPAKIKFLDLDDNETLSLKFDIYRDSTFTIRDFLYGGNPLQVDAISGHFGDTINSVVGRFVVTASEFYFVPKKKVYDYFKDKSTIKEEESNTSNLLKSIMVSRLDLYSVALSYSSRLSVELSGKQSTSLNLKFMDSSAERTKDMLSMLIAVYNGRWLSSKNQIAKSTSNFIDDRLDIIQKELGTVDEDISSFKSETMMPDLEKASSMYMSKSEEISTQLLQLNNELYMARYIKSYLVSGVHQNELLPVNTGLQSTSISDPVSKYNEMLLKRDAILAKSSDKNPVVQTYNKSLEDMRNSIISSIDQEIVSLNSKIRDLKGSAARTNQSIKSSPTQAKHLLSIERQQKVKESLYLYLLQKREENELSQAFTAYNTQVVTPPTRAIRVAPIPMYIFAIAIVIGLFIPISVIVLLIISNSTVRGKDDLKYLNIPIIGEIPLYAVNRKDLKPTVLDRIRKLLIKAGVVHEKKKHEEVIPDILVAKGERNIINEAFRVTRTNIEFMTSMNDSNVILMTSFNPGSGKSFSSMNIAASLAIRGVKVLVFDCDLRHASASHYVGKVTKGSADYLAGRTDDYQSLIINHPNFENLFVLPVGTIPPNPSELLSDPRFEDLVEELKKEFKYVILDCPPFDMVADTQIVSKVADRTLFVVRVGLMERSMLSELKQIYNDGRLTNMTILLNGSNAAGKYGYRYGYKYGYRYGYHYGFDGKKGSYYYGSK